MTSQMLDAALRYHAEGLCVIPCKTHDKAPALPEWKEYQVRQSTADEVRQWFGNGNDYNIGISHGINGFVSLDFDHDTGIFADFSARFPFLVSGRIEQSGSLEGYHVPLFVDNLPDFGWDNDADRPKGNKTYKSPQGNVNIRARFCQTVVPPSIHPSGNPYRFIADKPLIHVADLNQVIAWLNTVDPLQRSKPRKYTPKPNARPDRGFEYIKSCFPSLLDVFHSLGFTGDEPDRSGETRILGNGGLLIDEDNHRWYCFGDETGGDVIDAFGWAKFGSAWDRHGWMFGQIIEQMKVIAGIGDTRRLLPDQEGRRSTNIFRSQLRSSYWSKR